MFSSIAGKKYRIHRETFASVVIHQENVFAASYRGSYITSVVYVFNHNTTSVWRSPWALTGHFRALKGWVTLSILNNRITCCSREFGSIACYSLSGELLQTYGACERSGDTGQLSGPVISDDDDDGGVLIANHRRNGLQVMSEQGEFSVLQLQPPVSEPRGAVLFNNNLYVTSEDKKTVYKYSC